MCDADAFCLPGPEGRIRCNTEEMQCVDDSDCMIACFNGYCSMKEECATHPLSETEKCQGYSCEYDSDCSTYGGGTDIQFCVYGICSF